MDNLYGIPTANWINDATYIHGYRGIPRMNLTEEVLTRCFKHILSDVLPPLLKDMQSRLDNHEYMILRLEEELNKLIRTDTNYGSTTEARPE